MIRPSGANYKEDYARYISRATTLVHSPETTSAIQELLGGTDPVQKIADASVMVMQRVDRAARQSGVEVQDAVKIHAAIEIVSMVAELGEASGRTAKLPRDLILLAVSTAMQDYVKGEIAGKRINPQQAHVALQADLRTLQPKARKDIQNGMNNIQVIARKYNHGQGIASFK